MQDRVRSHSELTVHSGRHPGGLPTNEGRQEQTAWPFIWRHWLFGPQGVGMQGSMGSASIIAKVQAMIFLLRLSNTFCGRKFSNRKNDAQFLWKMLLSSIVGIQFNKSGMTSFSKLTFQSSTKETLQIGSFVILTNHAIQKRQGFERRCKADLMTKFRKTDSVKHVKNKIFDRKFCHYFFSKAILKNLILS